MTAMGDRGAMARCATLLLAVAGLMLGGCDDDDEGESPYVGLYAIEGHTLSSMGCDAPMDLVDGCFRCVLEKPYFKIEQSSFFGATILSAIECDDTDTCDDDEDDPDTIDLTLAFSERQGDGWYGETSQTSHGGASCDYTRTRYHLDSSSPDVITVRRVAHVNTPESASGMLDRDTCRGLTDAPPDEADLVCDQTETITARRVE